MATDNRTPNHILNTVELSGSTQQSIYEIGTQGSYVIPALAATDSSINPLGNGLIQKIKGRFQRGYMLNQDKADRINTIGLETETPMDILHAKVAAIIPITNEAINWSEEKLMQEYGSAAADALWRELDYAILNGFTLNSGASFDGIIPTATAISASTINNDAVYALEDAIADLGGIVNGFAARTRNFPGLRPTTATDIQLFQNGSLNGSRVALVTDRDLAFTNNTLLAGDFSSLHYNVGSINMRTSDSATLTSLARSGNAYPTTGVTNLFEDDAAALRLVMPVSVGIETVDGKSQFAIAGKPSVSTAGIEIPANGNYASTPAPAKAPAKGSDD
jgi:hypothetical protein